MATTHITLTSVDVSTCIEQHDLKILKAAVQGDKDVRKTRTAAQEAQKHLDAIVQECEAGNMPPQAGAVAADSVEGTSWPGTKLEFVVCHHSSSALCCLQKAWVHSGLVFELLAE